MGKVKQNCWIDALIQYLSREMEASVTRLAKFNKFLGNFLCLFNI